MCVLFNGRESGFTCGFCWLPIYVHQEVPPYCDEAPGSPLLDCNPAVAEVNERRPSKESPGAMQVVARKRTICHRCAKRRFSGDTLPTLSNPAFEDVRMELLELFRKMHGLNGESDRAAVVFSDGLKRCIEEASREFAAV